MVFLDILANTLMPAVLVYLERSARKPNTFLVPYLDNFIMKSRMFVSPSLFFRMVCVCHLRSEVLVLK